MSSLRRQGGIYHGFPNKWALNHAGIWSREAKPGMCHVRRRCQITPSRRRFAAHAYSQTDPADVVLILDEHMAPPQDNNPNIGDKIRVRLSGSEVCPVHEEGGVGCLVFLGNPLLVFMGNRKDNQSHLGRPTADTGFRRLSGPLAAPYDLHRREGFPARLEGHRCGSALFEVQRFGWVYRETPILRGRPSKKERHPYILPRPSPCHVCNRQSCCQKLGCGSLNATCWVPLSGAKDLR